MDGTRDGVGPVPASAPAGWYPTAGGLRYWDGTRWTAHVAPDPGRPAAQPPVDGPSAGASSRPGAAAWWGWGGLVVVAFLSGLSDGLGGFLMGAGLYLLVVAVVALVRGRVAWARLRGRATAGAALAGAIVLTGIGGATAEPSAPTSSAGASATTAASPAGDRVTSAPSATPTVRPSPTARPTTDRRATPSPTRTSPPSTPPGAARPTAAPGTALAALAAVRVKGRAPKTGYDRDRFGQAWADVDRNGCDTRNDVLRRDLTRFTLKAGTHGCLVLSGTLAGPYTGRTIRFVRGVATSSAVQIDHVVALSDAWQKGAQQLDQATRTAFANDPLGLLAVDGPTNAAKGDGDAATWLPPRTGYRCTYVARQVAVKLTYHLWVTPAEHDAIARILRTCPAQELPTGGRIRLGGGPEQVVPPTPAPTAPEQTPGGGTDPRFGTCKDALAHGYGHYVRGRDPEYDWYRDADGDGVVCE